jgi:hypothetical protein
VQDSEIVRHINELVEEEHRLERDHAAGSPVTDEQEQRLHDLEVELDRCWDLLRQRRARRHAGEDPDLARERDARTVEGYQQ